MGAQWLGGAWSTAERRSLAIVVVVERHGKLRRLCGGATAGQSLGDGVVGERRGRALASSSWADLAWLMPIEWDKKEREREVYRVDKKERARVVDGSLSN